MSAQDGVESVVAFVGFSLARAEKLFFSLPGSDVLARYVKSSYKNDPGRSLLELILFLFVVRTLLQSRTRADSSGTFLKLTEKEIDELVDEWVPEPLLESLNENQLIELATIPVVQGAPGPKQKLLGSNKSVVNLSSFNFCGLQSNEQTKEQTIEALRKYGLGSCSPPGFYGTIDVHMDLERNIANFLGTESCIVYAQDFMTISSVIPAFCKRGDIIVVDRGVNFAIHKGTQLSRSTIRWFDHNDLKSLETVLLTIDKEQKKRRAKLTRRFIVTEGLFENDGQIVDLPKLVELKKKYKYRLVLDESLSIGTLGRTGRGLTELYNVPASEVDMIVGSASNAFCAAGGFCAGSEVVVNHQRINGTAYVYSASLPSLLAVAASEGINQLVSSPSLLLTLHDNIRAFRLVMDALATVCPIHIPSHPASAIMHIQYKPQIESSLSPSSVLRVVVKHTNPTQLTSRNALLFDTEEEERLLQNVVDEALSQGVLLSRAHRLKGQEAMEPRPSIRIAITGALSRKEIEKAAATVKAAFIKVLGKRR